MVRSMRMNVNHRSPRPDGAAHRSDADCAPHLVDGECLVCGVVHGDECAAIWVDLCGHQVRIPGCGGRGYHRDGCRVSEVG